MTALAQPLARRIDRAARWAHRHHRFAHHPLCGAYAGERLRLGRYQVCRGCALGAAGGAAGMIAGMLFAPLPFAALALTATAGATLGLAALARRLSHGGKWISRALPAGLAGLVLCDGLVRANSTGLTMASVTVALAYAGTRVYRHRGPWRRPCETCPERGLAPCSGFRLAFRRERAFQRLTGRWISAERVDAPHQTIMTRFVRTSSVRSDG
jgi:hypothetical protein